MNDTTETTGQAPELSPAEGQAPAATPATPIDPQEVAKLRSELDRARKEAAQYRVERKQAEEKALAEQGNFKSLYEQLQAEHETLKGEITAKEAQRLRGDIAREFSLPEQLAARLQGDDEDTLRQDAQTLASLIKPGVPVAPSTGATQPGRVVAPQGVEAQIDSEWSKFYKGRKPGIKF